MIFHGGIDFSKEQFHDVIRYHPYTIGRYDEKRAIYTSELFTKTPGEPRCIHLGIDLGAPSGTPVYAPCDGEVAFVGYNDAHLDYGFCLVTKHVLQGQIIYFLFGHLAADVMRLSKQGTRFERGALLAHLGSYEENGHWSPHLHFQLSFREPVTHDLPGVCSEKDRRICLQEFPDPRLVLGPIY
jgi:murein DD-endopeptidase MepM/ murein hydrolase activator NlpD